MLSARFHLEGLKEMIPKGFDDWKFVIEGIVFAMFILPFLQAQLSKMMGGRATVSKNTA